MGDPCPKTPSVEAVVGTGEGSAARLLNRFLADPVLRKKHKKSLRRIKAACDVLEKDRVSIAVDAVARQIRLRHGRRASPTETGISSNRNTLLRYVQLRRQEQTRSTLKRYS